MIEEVIGDFVQLKKSGSSYKGLSPFTNEKTPSFYVSPAKGIFKCFSSGKGGNAVTFLMEHEKLSYPEALRWLADKYNIEIEEEKPNEEEMQERSERESLLAVSSYAAKFFEEYMWNHDEGQAIACRRIHPARQLNFIKKVSPTKTKLRYLSQGVSQSFE